MKLECTEELEVIREKCSRRAFDLNDKEKQCLSVVHEEINFKVLGKKMTLNLSCSSCVMSAVNQVYNYITFHEEKETPPPSTKANVTIVTDSKEAYRNMKLKELRELFPDIKATSVEKFIEQI